MLIHTNILISVTSVKARQPDIMCLLKTVQEKVKQDVLQLKESNQDFMSHDQCLREIQDEKGA